MTELQSLIERVEKETGADADLDAAIAIHFGAIHRSRRSAGGVNRGREWLEDSHGGVETWSRHPPAYTASLDAALSLVERKLPGCGWTVSRPSDEVSRKKPSAHISQSEALWTYDGWPEVEAATPALALILALLKAIQAEKEGAK